jgi:spore coat polysaccharide biosynthesis protein SpsF
MTQIPKVVCITQARTTSTRLPGKVLMEVEGKALLVHHLERLQRCQQVHEVVLATTVNPSDDEVAYIGKSLSVRVIRGSEHDVLSRYVMAAEVSNADLIVRVTSDCPLIDPALVDKVVRALIDDDTIDYANLDMTNFPRGLDSEAFRRSILHKANEDPMTTYYEREHVTPYIYNRPDHYKLKAITGLWKTPAWRWCVDEQADFELVSLIMKTLLPRNRDFTWTDCAELMVRNPDWAKLNQQVIQKGVVS